MKKLLAILVVMVMVVSVPVSLAEESAATAKYESVLSLEKASLRFIDGTNFASGKDYGERGEGVINTEGEILLPFEYGAVSYEGFDHFEVINENGINNHALINTKNEVVIDYKYSAFEVVSAKWGFAVILEETDEEKGDYGGGFFGGGEQYMIKQVDLYDLSAAKLVQSFERAQYKSADFKGGRLYIEDRDGNYKVYDDDFNFLADTKSSYENEYEIGSEGITSKYTGEVIANTGAYDNVSSIDGFDNLLIVRDRSRYGVINKQGDIIVSADYDYCSGNIKGNYMEVEIRDLYGLVDLLTGKEVVPCEYEKIIASYTGGTANYNNNGYFLVETDGKLGFVDTNGNVTCDITYSTNSAVQHGCSLSITDMDGTLYIIAADGTKTATELKEIYEYSGGDGYTLIASNGKGYGIVDWYGNTILDFTEEYTHVYDISDDGNYLIKDGAELLRLVR